ncbi:MAG: TIGR02281 family clan AA aspartic protease [Pseudomonadota bacterium]
MLLWILLALLMSAAIGALVLGDGGTLGGFDGGMLASATALLALLIFLGSSLGRDYIGRAGQAMKDFAIWVGIALVLVLGYSFRDEAQLIYQRLAGELMPPGTGIHVGTNEVGQRAVRIRKRPDGHFAVRSRVNGQSVTMLVDTGATTIVLTPADAQAAGIQTDTLRYTIPVQTANGTAYAAAVRLGAIAVGPIELRGLDALVAKQGALRESLLGMNFLKELRDFRFTGEFLTLRG